MLEEKNAWRWVRWLKEVRLADVGSFGGKNASLGELIANLSPSGIAVPSGFAVSAAGYRYFLRFAELEAPIRRIVVELRKDDVAGLLAGSARIRELILGAPLPPDLVYEIDRAYRALSAEHGEEASDVAVRSSATAEDLPNASFAGQQDSFLNVRGAGHVVQAVKKGFASLFTPRAIHYRRDMGFPDEKVAISVGVQKMVRSDKASAGVIFTLDPDTGHRGVILISSSYGLGESVVQGRVAPDQLYVHKATLAEGYRSLFWKRLGAKEERLVYDESGHRDVRTIATPLDERGRFSVSDEDALTLARWSAKIEEHYSALHGAPTPMDIEWAKDGLTGKLYIVQARPETVHSQRPTSKLRVYTVDASEAPILRGLAVGSGVASGAAHIIRDPHAIGAFRPGSVLVTENTDPDWEPIMRIAAAIVTERGGRTSHAAIVARELGIPAVVGASGACTAAAEGQLVTVSCAEASEGRVYRGAIPFSSQEIDIAPLRRPKTKIMLNVGNPDQALKLSLLPSDGVGLARMEFIFASWVGVHPLALTRFATLPSALQGDVDRLTAGYSDKTAYFVDRLTQGIATIAAAFHPRPVTVRFSDFKTNEYARLLGGSAFEPTEENPMLGWRGASRYYHPSYEEGFLLEVAAVKRVREELGLRNVKVMIPFCRTPAEGEKVLATMKKGGLVRGENGLEVWVMAEIPSNIILAEDFARIFDGFSIGSNDLTQLVLGVDRDSTTIAPLFDERSPALRWAFAQLLAAAAKARRPVGICGQAPSDHPDLAAFLVESGIDSMSLSSDALVAITERVVEVEARRR